MTTHNIREESKKYPSHRELDMEKYERIVRADNFDGMFNYGFDVGLATAAQEKEEAVKAAVKATNTKWGKAIEQEVASGVPPSFEHLIKRVIAVAVNPTEHGESM